MLWLKLKVRYVVSIWLEVSHSSATPMYLPWQARSWAGTCDVFQMVRPASVLAGSVGRARLFAACRSWSRRPSWAEPGGRYGTYPLLRLRPGVTADDIQFPPLGYSAAAIELYAEFARLKREGIIPRPLRFQVCLPTPLAPIHGVIVPEDQPTVEAAYQARMLTELNEILAAIPAQELAIQWDTAVEFLILEGLLQTYLVNPAEEILTRLVRLGNQVPAGVELGYHLCYGDAGHQHFKEPEDMSKLVTIATGIVAGLARPLTWLHMPVPRNRTDAAYFAPLRQLRLGAETELYLGLVHRTDGVAGTRQRIRAAQQVVSDFGVATECGLGRRPAETIPEVLQIHAAVAAPVR